MKSDLPDIHNGQTPHHKISTIFTLLFLVLLVGSLLIVVNLVSRSHSGNGAGHAGQVASVAGRAVYVADGAGGMNKLDASTGKPLWRFQTGAKTIPAPATVAGDLVYFAGTDGVVHALNAANGTERWHFTTGGTILGSPAVSGNVVYAGSDDGNVYALDARTGAKLWSYFAGKGNQAVSLGTAAIINGVLYDSASDNVSQSYLFALNASTGAALWSRQVGNQLLSAPQIAGGNVYVTATAITQPGQPASTVSHVYVFNAQNGSPAGRVAAHAQAVTNAGVLLAPPAVVNNAVFYGSRNGDVSALSADGSKVLWTTNVGGEVDAAPVVSQQTVYVGMSTGTITNNAILALNAANGKQLWQHTLANYAAGNIVVNGGVLYVGTSTGAIYALNASTGAQLWVYQEQSPFSNTPLTVVG